MSTPTLREAAERLVRWHLDNAEVHPCDVNNDDIRADQCISEVRDLRAALAAPAPAAAPDGWRGLTDSERTKAVSDIERILFERNAPRPAPAEPITKEWCMNMAQVELDAGSPDMSVGPAPAIPAQQPAGGELECERCGQSPGEHTPSHWCENQSFSQPQPTMADALAAGDGTLHGAIDHWQARALKAEAGERKPPLEWRKAVMEAYGHLWNINTEPGAPIPMVSPEQAATKARKCLLSLLTKAEQGAAIRAALGPGFFLEGGITSASAGAEGKP